MMTKKAKAQVMWGVKQEDGTLLDILRTRKAARAVAMSVFGERVVKVQVREV